MSQSNQTKNNARISDVSTFIKAGINPKTGLPLKMGSLDDCGRKNDIRIALRIMDEQDAIRRFNWYNLPNGLTGELIERILYYQGQAAFFYLEATDEFYFLPYALAGGIDVYGRYNTITPLPFNGGTTSSDDGKKKPKPWIVGLEKKVIKKMPETIDIDNFLDGCVLLHDYSKQRSEEIIARQVVNDPILDVMAEAYPMARTALIANSGIKAMRVQNGDQQANVQEASDSVQRAALTGKPWIPVVGEVEFQDFTSQGSAMKSEEYLMYMQSLDNFRLSTYGLENGGIFQKKAHELQSENDMMTSTRSRAYTDCLTLRQEFCDLVNAVWGLGIAVEASETVQGDQDMDGDFLDDQDQSGQAEGAQPEGATDNE